MSAEAIQIIPSPQVLPQPVDANLAPVEPITPEIMDKKRWHEYVPVMVARAHETGTALSAAFIDVDHFKDINDTLGHDVGDEVIDGIKHEVMGFVATNLRTGRDDAKPEVDRRSQTSAKTDVLAVDGFSPAETPQQDSLSVSPAHVGGDEFALLANTDETGIQLVAKRLQEAFNSWVNRPENARLKELGIRLSVGVATLKKGMSDSEFLRVADQDMYKNKLANLPPLTEKQMKVLRVAKMAIESEQLRMRDLLKYEALLDQEV